MNLFVDGEFTSHSGIKLPFKIDCDALTDADIETIAKAISKRFSFGTVVGVPTGGLRLANALKQYTVNYNKWVLIVDDVLTTGASMEEMKQYYIDLDMGLGIVGVVIFARGPCNYDWITPIFTTAF